MEAAHIRFASAKHGKPITGIGIKPDDQFVLPLCGKCHRLAKDAQHEVGEAAFWGAFDPVALAKEIYRNTGNAETCEKIVREAFRTFTYQTE